MLLRVSRAGFLASLIAVMTCSCQQEKASAPSEGAADPRTALRELIHAIDRLDEGAFLRSLGKQQESLALARSLFALLKEADAFEKKLVEAYGEKARGEYRETLAGALFHGAKEILRAYARRLDEVPVVYEGQRAYMPAAESNQWIRFNRVENRWFVDAGSMFVFETSWDEARVKKSYNATAQHLKGATAKIGQAGATADSALIELEDHIGWFPRELLFGKFGHVSPEPVRPTEEIEVPPEVRPLGEPTVPEQPPAPPT